jgi:hypothetical protein
MGRRGPRARPVPAPEDAEPKPAWAVLTGRQYWTLAFGRYLDGPPAFANEAEEAAAWHQHKTEILRDWSRPGRRPRLFWRYEHPEPPPFGATTESAHVWLAIADATERAAIEDRWRSAVAYCIRQHRRDRRAAQKLAFSWGDVPRWAFRQIVAEMAQASSVVMPSKGPKRARVK